MHLILDDSYLVGNLTNAKIAETKALEPLKSWHFCISNFRTCLITQRDMSGPRLRALSNNRLSGGISTSEHSLCHMTGSSSVSRNESEDNRPAYSVFSAKQWFSIFVFALLFFHWIGEIAVKVREWPRRWWIPIRIGDETLAGRAQEGERRQRCVVASRPSNSRDLST